ncbi:hypothetical protein TR75_03795 [Hydrogenibacillus schlegelii]|uniref:hypothetical protein n=1 Tax=Hydrogenibacillus schlegelii TaxID=1484 RepID=UPI00079392EA|nr:hypothetical protein [Hydrogenibacillus schlegelii]KWX07172.1 hypothetical protein TR75_03795 [Hydrogenibacillus schlegelii]
MRIRRKGGPGLGDGQAGFGRGWGRGKTGKGEFPAVASVASAEAAAAGSRAGRRTDARRREGGWMLPIALLSLAVVSLLAVSVLERIVERREAMGLFWAEADLEALVKSGAAFVFALPYCLPAELPHSEPIVFASAYPFGGSAAGGGIGALAASVDFSREGSFEAMFAPGEGWAVSFPATGLAGETVCVSWRLEPSDGEAVAMRLLAAVAPEAVPPPEDGAAWRVLWEGATAGADAGVDEGCSAEGAHSALWTIEEGDGVVRRRGWLRWEMVSFSGAGMEEGRPLSGGAGGKGSTLSGETNEEGSFISGGSEKERRQVRFSELKLRPLDPCRLQREALKALEEIAPRAGRWVDRAGRPADGPVGTIRVAAFAGPDPAADAPAEASAVSAADVRFEAASGARETPRLPAWAAGTLEVAMPAPDLLTAPLPAEYDRIERRYTFLRSFSDGPGGLRDRLACWARTNWSGYDPKRHACRGPE